MTYQYEMPTQLFFGELSSYAAEFSGYGKRALIVTGRSSAGNGALDDVLTVLSSQGLEAAVFDRTEENPSLQNVTEAALTGRAFKADFVIGLGGGSPLDAAKAVSLLLANDGANGSDLYNPTAFPNSALPVLSVPTTAGTGSEVTPFAILTDHLHHTKASLPYRVFPRKAFLNSRYTLSMPYRLTVYTAVDALAHLIEGYLSSRANPLSDAMAEGGLSAFATLLLRLKENRLDMAARDELLTLSSVAGIVIAQAKTTLPHQMGYALTYYKKIPHGAACGVLLAEYMRFWNGTKEKTDRIIKLLGLSDIDAFKQWITDVLDIRVDISEDEIDAYTCALCENPEKLKAHPGSVTPEDIKGLYQKSLL